jgi:hypothetical protein
MATEIQKRANRANSLKSTGPQTDAGKAVVRLNATRHGLLSSAPVMAGEDADEYAQFCAQMQSDLAPVGIFESQLCDRMTGTLWRLRRLSHIEAGILTGNAAQTFAVAAESVAASHTRTEGGLDALLASMSDTGTLVIEDEAAHADATQAAQDARGVSWSVPALLGAAYRVDATGADALTKLSRYETTLERSLFKTGEELRRIQEARHERETEQASLLADVRREIERRGLTFPESG